MLTANGLGAATFYISDWDMFICVKLVEDSPAVLSLGMLREEMVDA